MHNFFKPNTLKRISFLVSLMFLMNLSYAQDDKVRIGSKIKSFFTRDDDSSTEESKSGKELLLDMVAAREGLVYEMVSEDILTASQLKRTIEEFYSEGEGDVGFISGPGILGILVGAAVGAVVGPVVSAATGGAASMDSCKGFLALAASAGLITGAVVGYGQGQE